MTAFVMVAGVFSAAVYTDSNSWSAEQGQPIAISEQEEGMGGAGEAPASAFANSESTIETSLTSMTDTDFEAPPQPMEVPLIEPMGDSTLGLPNMEGETPSKQVRMDGGAQKEIIPSESDLKSIEPAGTRSPDPVVDAGGGLGPYGTEVPFDPYYEGDPIPLMATVDDDGEDVTSAFMYRWDYRNDGSFDGPGAAPDYWGALGDNTDTTFFYDDHQGTTRVQAWDTTWTTGSGGGRPQFENTVTPTLYYMSGSPVTSWGWDFEALQDCTIDEVGYYKYGGLGGHPVEIIAIRIYDSSSLLMELSYPLPAASNNQWKWYDLTDNGEADVDLTAGEEYLISYTITGDILPYYSLAPHGYFADAGDAYIDPIQMRYWNQNGRPPWSLGTARIPKVDLHYTYTFSYPNVVEDTEDVFVWNREPLITEVNSVPISTGEPATYEFSGSFMDLGRDDTWQYMWDFGDGTVTPWMDYRIQYVGGGADVLVLHSWGTPPSGYGIDALLAGLPLEGGFVKALDTWDYSPVPYGTGTIPTLEYMLDYDVVICGSNYYQIWNEEVGDLLADFSDIKGAEGSGGVITMPAAWYTYDPGVMGRWRSENYDALDPYPGLYLGAGMSIGTVYEPGHMIMENVNNIGGSPYVYTMPITSVARGERISDWAVGQVLAATYGNPYGSGARHASINFLPSVYVPTGDWITMVYNAIRWTSRQPEPTPLPQPYHTDPIAHTYVDDHPEHVTPSDEVTATFYIRDDDHGRDVELGGRVSIYNEDFDPWTSWGLYGNNPPAGWEIQDNSPSLDEWEWGEPEVGPSSGHSGDNVWGTDLDGNYENNADYWLKTPMLDLSGSANTELNFWMWQEIEFYWDRLLVQISTNNLVWTQVALYEDFVTTWTEYTVDISSLDGAPQAWVRFVMQTDASVTYRGAYIDDVEIIGYASVTETDLWEDDFEDGDISDWTLGGSANDWEVDTPLGFGSPADPVGAFRGTYSIGNDLTGLGTYWGEYENNIPTNGNYIYSPAIDCTGETNVKLEFYRWLGIESVSWDHASIEASNDGSSWTTIWEHTGGSFTDPTWIQVTYDISAVADDEATVYVRFEMGPTDASVTYCGWNIDDIRVFSQTMGTPTTILEVDFEADDGSFTHGGPAKPWDYNDWHRAYYSGSYTARVWYTPYEECDEWLIKLPFDTVPAGYPNLLVEFNTYLYGSQTNCEVLLSVDGAPWETVTSFGQTGSYQRMSFDISEGAGHEVSVAIRYTNAYAYYGYQYFDNFDLIGLLLMTVDGMAEATVDSTVNNVFPSVIGPATSFIIPENEALVLEGFEVTDPAATTATEEFYYRYIWGDGEQTDWIYKGSIAPPPMNVLMAETWSVQGPAIQSALRTELEAQLPGVPLVIDRYDWGPLGTNTAPPLSLLQQYDVVIVGENYIVSQPLRDAFGNVLADYSDTGGGVVCAWVTDYQTGGIQGRWDWEDYNPTEAIGLYFTVTTLGTVYEPGHPILEGVTDFTNQFSYTSTSLNAESVLVADLSSGEIGISYQDYGHHNPFTGRTVDLAMFPSPVYCTGDYMTLLANSVRWIWDGYIATGELPPVSHNFLDNGRYDVQLQVIDDDMYWEFEFGTGEEPVYVGPAGEEDLWVSIQPLTTEVLNVDPVISNLRASVALDLAIRVTGTPDNDATMTLWEGSTEISSVTLSHDGNDKIRVMPSVLHMENINDYYVTVEYDHQGGGNPTWIFQGRFPDGKIKELKKVFQDGDTVWTIGSEYLKAMVRGQDMMFQADVYDQGSDDLALVWNFGDTSPHAVNVYANVDQSTSVAGETCPPELLFGVLEEDADPWFDRPGNDDRSPGGTDILVNDETTHAFDENQAYYFIVMLTAFDDDTGDGYPSPYNNGGGYDMEFIEIDLS